MVIPDGEGLERRGVTLEDVQNRVNHERPAAAEIGDERPTRGTPGRRFPVTRGDFGGKALAGVLLAALMLLLPFALAAQPPLRVGTSGDYSPFSTRIPASESGDRGKPTYGGFDPELARAYAKDRGLEVVFIRFRWPDLLADLAADRFDVAMSGITIRPERSLAGRFSVPIALSGAVALVAEESPARVAEDLDRPDIRIAVNAGGHLERVARARFPRADLRAIPSNNAVIEALISGAVDAAISDTREAPHWQHRAPGLRRIGPFTRDRKALLVGADHASLSRDLDAWLLGWESRGALALLRQEYLGEGGPSGGESAKITSPLPALLAAIDERLALMPLVAEAKRLSLVPVEVPARETRVLEAAVAGVRRAEDELESARRETIPEVAIRKFFAAQIEAAKWLQRETLAGTVASRSGTPPDLETELRPALIRIGDRMARLLVSLPAGLGASRIEAATLRELVGSALPMAQKRAIARGLIAVAGAEPREEADPLQ